VSTGRSGRIGAPIGIGVAVVYMSLIVLIPFAALINGAFEDGWDSFWSAVTNDQAMAALRLTVTSSLIVVAINAVMGTIIAWVLVRDRFPGKAVVNAVIDLPFALPTIVAGITLLALYGPSSPFGVNIAFTQAGIVAALLLVSLPFVVRAVQPVLIELDRDMEQAAASLGAGRFTIFRRIIFPNLLPAVLDGVVLTTARALGEFGAVAVVSGRITGNTETMTLFVSQQYQQIGADSQTSAYAASLVLVLIAMITVVAMNLLNRKGRARGDHGH